MWHAANGTLQNQGKISVQSVLHISLCHERDNKMNADFPRIITLLRKERKISQKKASADLGVSQALLSHYEKGIRECGLDFLVKVADYYDVSVDYLLGRSPEPKGKTFTVNDIPDTSSEKDRVTPDAAVAIFSKKIVINSVNMLYAMIIESKNKKLLRSVTSSLNMAIYKAFRAMCSANPVNDANMFSVSQTAYRQGADAVEKLNEGICLSEAEVMKCKSETDAFAFSHDALAAQGYSSYASSMLNLIKNSEASIKELEAKISE